MILKTTLERTAQQAEILRKHEVNLQDVARYSFRTYRERKEMTVSLLAVKLEVTSRYVENVEAGLLMPSEAVCWRLIALAEADGMAI